MDRSHHLNDEHMTQVEWCGSPFAITRVPPPANRTGRPWMMLLLLWMFAALLTISRFEEYSNDQEMLGPVKTRLPQPIHLKTLTASCLADPKAIWI